MIELLVTADEELKKRNGAQGGTNPNPPLPAPSR
jgi:hypothetical protein